MTCRPTTCTVLLLSGIVGIGLAAQGPAATRSPARDRHVVLVSLDGFPARALDNPRLPTPTLRRLAREGAYARSLRVVNPSVTWPNHTTMVTGVAPAVHRVLFNGLVVREGLRPPRIEPWRPKATWVRAPTVYDAAHAAGLTTAEVDWVAIHQAETITWAFPEVPRADGPVEREMIARGLVTADDVAGFSKNTSSAWRDQVWTEAAIHILQTHRPNLLLFHLLNLDGTHHAYGPGASPAFTSMAFLDGQLARLLGAIEAAGLRDRTTVVVVSDHGFRMARRTIQPNVLLRRAGLIEGDGPALQARAFVQPWGGTAALYVADRERRTEIAGQARAALAGVEGLERIVEPGEFAALGLPGPSESDQAPDLVLVARDGFDFGRGAEGEPVIDTDATHRGHHGVLASEPVMDALFVAWGRDVAPGRVVERVNALDVAPTIAQWLGVPLPTAVGGSLAPLLGQPVDGR